MGGKWNILSLMKMMSNGLRFTAISKPRPVTKFLKLPKQWRHLIKKKWILDVHEFDYIDSSGLGMLIELHEQAESKGITLTITGAKPMVRRMFDLSKFDRLFKIVD